MAYNRIQHEKMAHSKTQKCTQKFSSRKYTCEWFKYKCSLCKLRFMSRKDKLNHELGFHCLKRRGSNFILKFYSHHLRPILIFSHGQVNFSVFFFIFYFVMKFESLQRIIWDNSTQKVRDQSWCQDAGLLPRKGENVEVKIFSKRSKARKFYHKNTESESNNQNERDSTIQTMASQHVQRLISSSRSGKPFNKKLSMMTDCEFCPRRYASRAALRAHEKRDHMDPNEIWLCLFCPKTYICKSFNLNPI